jgi:hypothetical protein
MLLSAALLITALVWAAGIPWFWHLQSRSRAVLNVTFVDRLMTLMWLPLYSVTILILMFRYIWGRTKA